MSAGQRVTESAEHPDCDLKSPDQVSTGRSGILPISTAQTSLGAGASRARIDWARAGDHAAIYNLLTTVFRSPSRDQFQAELDDPVYEPSDRLLVRHGRRIVAHLQLSKRAMCYGAHRVAMSRMTHFGTLPEFRGRGYATALLSFAHRQMREDGSQLGVLTTDQPEWFAKHGWIVTGGESYSRASARHIRAAMSAMSSPKPICGSPQKTILNIRHWRHVELDGLKSIYHQFAQHRVGPIDRSELYWRWLISRRLYDHIIVAINGPDKVELGSDASRIVGYAVTKGERLIELMTAPGFCHAGVQLLSRACSDSIERDLQSIELHLPPDHPLHELVVTAGGIYCDGINRPSSVNRASVHMVKLLDVEGFFERITPQLHQRAKQAKLDRPSQLDFVVGDRRIHLSLTRRSVRINSDATISRRWIRCTEEDLSRMLLCQIDLQQAVRRHRISASSAATVRTAAALFPFQPVWVPSLDYLSE